MPTGSGQLPRTHWSPETCKVFGIFDREPSSWEGPQWLDKFVSEGDRPDLRALWVRLLADESPILRIRSFVATPPTGRRYPIRAAGRRYVENGRVYLRGIAMRLPDHIKLTQPGHLGALLGLSRDPICMIDPSDEVIYVTTSAFRGLGLHLPDSRYLPAMCHDEDLSSLRELFRQATAHLGQVRSPVLVRLAARAGHWSQVEVSGVAVRLTSQSTHVWCRIRDLAA